jgi:hypothetical protein
MRRGLAGSLVCVLASAGFGWADTPLLPMPPPTTTLLAQGPALPPTEPRPVTPAIPMKSDAGVPFVVHPDTHGQLELPAESPRSRVWFDGEYLMQWMTEQPLSQPLVTTNTAGGVGAIGEPGAAVLFGPNGIGDLGIYSGVRLRAGLALDPCHNWGLEGNVVYLGERDRTVSFASDDAGNPVLSRPIIDAQTGTEDVFVVAFPEFSAGRIVIEARSQYWGAETNLVRNLVSRHWGGIDLIGGLRYAELEESLVIRDASLILGQGTGFFVNELVGPDNIIARSDAFETRNQFIGGQLGVKAEVRRGNWVLYGKTKLALGNTHQVLNINGTSTLIPPVGAPTTVPGGLLAISSNSGRHVQNDVGVLPELNLNIGYQINEAVRLYVGYDLLYWNGVARPGDSIDRNVNRSFVPTSESFGFPPFVPSEPTATIRSNDFWMQGVNFGISVRF